MAEYIEREALPQKKERGFFLDEDFNAGWNACLNNIESIPAADVAPVLHGHKITHNRPIAGYWASGLLDGGINGMEGRVWVMPIMDNPVDYCSECGKRLDDTFQNYCPNCGAKLDGE